MDKILINWILFFLLPAALSVFIAIRLKTLKAKLVALHIGISTSLILLFFAGARLQLATNGFVLAFFALTIATAYYLLSKPAILYVLSCIVQETCLLLASILLTRGVGLAWAIILTAAVFALGHLVDRSHWQLKLFATALWGACSIALYYYIQQPLLNFAVHILGGAILISRGVFYEDGQPKNRLAAKR
jgi:hypothetical protein